MDIEQHKRMHKPMMQKLTESGNEVRKTPHQGYYIPKNTGKVIGNPAEIIYRSGWERDLCRWCDDNPAVLRWGVEIAKIEYRDPGSVSVNDMKRLNLNPADPQYWPVRSYFIDFYIEIEGDKTDTGLTVNRLLVEVKPKAQTMRPVPPPDTAKLKEQKSFVKNCRTFLTNSAKWEAAKRWADDHEMKFVIWTEDQLHQLGII